MSGERKLSRKSFGGYKLISVKDFGHWEGVLWVKVKSLKEFDAMSSEEQDKVILQKCPKNTPTTMAFPTEYPYVRTECKSCHDIEGNYDGNCPFLFRYANDAMYNCRLILRNADERIYWYD